MDRCHGKWCSVGQFRAWEGAGQLGEAGLALWVGSSALGRQKGRCQG